MLTCAQPFPPLVSVRRAFPHGRLASRLRRALFSRGTAARAGTISLDGSVHYQSLHPYKPLLWAGWAMVCMTMLASFFHVAFFQRCSAVNAKCAPPVRRRNRTLSSIQPSLLLGTQSLNPTRRAHPSDVPPAMPSLRRARPAPLSSHAACSPTHAVARRAGPMSTHLRPP